MADVSKGSQLKSQVGVGVGVGGGIGGGGGPRLRIDISNLKCIICV